jgi:hypothetical protein
MLLIDFIATTLPSAQCERQVVSMLLGVAQYDATTLLHRWLRAVQVQPSESLARLEKAFPTLFLVDAQPGCFHELIFSCMLA